MERGVAAVLVFSGGFLVVPLGTVGYVVCMSTATNNYLGTKTMTTTTIDRITYVIVEHHTIADLKADGLDNLARFHKENGVAAIRTIRRPAGEVLSCSYIYTNGLERLVCRLGRI